MSRRRSGTRVGTRSASTRRTASKEYPPKDAAGSKMQAYATSIGVTSVSE